MKFLLSIIQFLVYSNSWIGLGAAAFTWQFYLITDLHIRYDIIALNFFATVLTYTFQRYIKILNGSHGTGERLNWMLKHDRLVKIILVITAIGCAFSIYELTFPSYLMLIGGGLLSFFYVVKIPGKRKSSLRDIPSLKIYIIALVWASTSTFLPYFNIGEESNAIPWINFIAHFIFIIAITIPFDIRDIHLDEADKKTIPQLIGVRNAAILAIGLLLINYFISPDYFPAFSIANTLFLIYAIILVWLAQKKLNDLFFSFWIDGLLILQAISIFTQYLLTKGLV